MNGKAKGTGFGKRKHRFHQCRNDNERWEQLDNVLLLIAGQIDQQDTSVRKQLSTITRKLSTLMASLQEVKDELEALKTDTAAEHAQFAQVQQALADKIAELQAIIDAGPGGATSAELGDLLTGLQEVHAQVSAIVPDEPTA